MLNKIFVVVLGLLMLSVPVMAATVYQPFCCYGEYGALMGHLPPGVGCWDPVYQMPNCGPYACLPCNPGYGYGYGDDGDDDDHGKGWSFVVESSCEEVTVTVDLDQGDEADVTIFGVGSGTTEDHVFTVSGNYCGQAVDIYASVGSEYEPGSLWEYGYQMVSCDECGEPEPEPECTSDADCATGEVCVENECEPAPEPEPEEPTAPEGAGGGEPQCTYDEDCLDTEYCTEEGDCVPVECVCGYPSNHACVYYDCGTAEEGCEPCAETNNVCIEHECKEVDIQVGDGEVGDTNKTGTVLIDGEPYVGDVEMTHPDGTKTIVHTDENGQFTFDMDSEGSYVFTVVTEGGEAAAEATAQELPEAVPEEPGEEEPAGDGGLAALLLVVVLLGLILGLIAWRTAQKGKKK